MVAYITICDACGERAPLHADDCSLVDEAPYLVPTSAAFDGLAGEVVRALAPHTEADPAAVLLNVLAEFGAMVGGAAETQAGSAKHPPAISVALVGRTARSRKGTSERETSALMTHVEDGWEARHRMSGFGSGEAFIEHAAANPGESIYMVESEFARVLAVASREGSSASSVLRAAWDFGRLEHRIRKQTYEAPPAPVTLVAHITADELRDGRHGLRMNDVMNGFGNRVLWGYVDRRSIIPNLEPVPDHVRNTLVAHLRAALVRARGAGLVRRSPEASDLWSHLYRRMAEDDPTGIVGALTARAEAQVLRLSLVYALSTGARPSSVGTWKARGSCGATAGGRRSTSGSGPGPAIPTWTASPRSSAPARSSPRPIWTACSTATRTSPRSGSVSWRSASPRRSPVPRADVMRRCSRLRRKRRKRRKGPRGGSCPSSTAIAARAFPQVRVLLPLLPLLPQPKPGRAPMRKEADVSAWLRRYLDGEDEPGDLDLIDPADLEPCPSCGAMSDVPGYPGHAMRCRRYYREDAGG